jgi:transposase-like protein
MQGCFPAERQSNQRSKTMLSDSPSKQLKKSKRIRSITAPTNKQWSDSQKMEAIQSYLLLGNLALTSRILGIPEITLRVWKTSQWWKDTVAEIKSQEKVELSSKMKKLVGASLAVVEDRLINGDFQFDQKTGEVIRKPVNMKDAHKVAMDMQERQDLIDKSLSGEESKGDEGVQSRLLKLAEQFAEMATKKIEQKVDEHRTIDVEDAKEV